MNDEKPMGGYLVPDWFVVKVAIALGMPKPKILQQVLAVNEELQRQPGWWQWLFWCRYRGFWRHGHSRFRVMTWFVSRFVPDVMRYQDRRARAYGEQAKYERELAFKWLAARSQTPLPNLDNCSTMKEALTAVKAWKGEIVNGRESISERGIDSKRGDVT